MPLRSRTEPLNSAGGAGALACRAARRTQAERCPAAIIEAGSESAFVSVWLVDAG